MSKVRFLQHCVKNESHSAKVWYSLDNRTDGRKCVTIYAKEYGEGRRLGYILPDTYENNTDSMVDYFEKGMCRVFEDSPYYKDARARAELNQEIKSQKRLLKTLITA